MFQAKFPNKVTPRKVNTFIFPIPAGKEINVRIKGINLAIRTIRIPYLLKR